MLRHLSSGRLVRLRPRTTVGRGSSNIISLRSRLASGEHAVLSWTGDGWSVRDLGSRNGTWVGDRRLAIGETVDVERGQTVAFGDAGDRWQLVEDGPPRLFAESMVDRAVVDAVGGVLALPSSDEPTLMVFASGDGWVAEGEDDARAVHDQDVVVVGETPWRVSIPETIPATVTAGPSPAPLELWLELAVSRDHEFVEVRVHGPEGWVTLAPRSYHYMLVVLAQERLADEGASAAERGWLHLESLADKLVQAPRTLNVHICRLRQQVGQAGLADAASIIERRPGTGQVRLGTDAVSIRDL